MALSRGNVKLTKRATRIKAAIFVMFLSINSIHPDYILNSPSGELIFIKV